MPVSFEDEFTEAERNRILQIIQAEKTAAQDPTVAGSAAGQFAETIKTEEERIAAFEGRTGPLRRDPSGGLAEFNEPAIRADIMRQKGRLPDIKRKLESHVPGIEIVDLEEPIAGSRVAVRVPGQKDFVVLDSNSIATVSDFADAAGALFNAEMAATIAGTLATRGALLVPRILGVAGSAMLGSAADETIETARGFQNDPIDEVFTDEILPAGAFAVAGEAAAIPARGAANIALKRGVAKTTPEERQAIQTFEDADVNMSVGALIPGLQSAEGQAVATSKNARDFALRQTRNAMEDLKRQGQRASATSELTDSQLDDVARGAAADIKALITASPNVSREQAGRMLKAGREAFKKIWKVRIGRKYDRALAAGENARFNLSETQALASRIKKGVIGRGKEVEGEVQLLGYQAILEAQRERLPVQLQQLNKGIRDVIDDILDLDPEVAAFEGNTAFEQIKALRTRLFDLKNATVDGKETIQNRFAGQLWDDLTRVMDEPAGASENFKLLLRSANNTNKRFERIKEVTDIARIARETEPGNLIEIVKPGKAFTLRTIRRLWPAENWERFRQGYISSLTNDAKTITSKLDEFAADPQTLRLILSEGEESTLRRVGENTARLEQTIKSVKASKLGRDKRAMELIDNGDIETIETLIKKGGGKESPLGKSLRRSVWNVIEERSRQVIKGVIGTNANKAMSQIRRLEQNGVLDAVMLPGEKEALKNRELMFSLFLPSPDAGVSIRAAELQSNLVEPLNPIGLATDTRGVLKRFLSGAGGLTRNYIVGTVLMSPTARKMIIGSATRPIDLTTIRILSNITAQTAADLEQEQEPVQ